MIDDTETMGISETREFTPTDKQELFGRVIFAETENDRECMPYITLSKEFASNAKKIRVTVDIIE